MPLTLRVTWRHAGAPLLPDALSDVRATVDDAPLSPAKSGPGLREFELPEDVARVALTARFSAAFDAVEDRPPAQHEVLAVEQAYDVVAGGTRLQPIAGPENARAHPLVTTKPAAEHGVFVAEIGTDFVDVTPFWLAYADNVEEYLREHRPGTELVVLGATAGDPKIWFASIPAACQSPPGEGLSALVFYRPESYPYSRIDQRHDMFGLNRYLLRPDPDPEAEFWARDVFAKDPRDGSRWVWVRAGFEDALAASGKAVVMLCPWPSGASFGHATSARLPGLVEAALRFLWGQRKVALGRPTVRLGRLGLAGFSAGGLALWSALASNTRRVAEVFSFDARGTAANTPTLLRWFQGDPSRRLRMTGGYQLAANEAIRKVLARSGGARFSSSPPDKNGYLPGANPRWDHVCSDLEPQEIETCASTEPVWHQFALFGGPPVPRRAGQEGRQQEQEQEAPRSVTFLQRFLEDSGF
jgi:hypothetical protein